MSRYLGPMNLRYVKRPMEFIGIHLPDDCGCYPKEIYEKVVAIHTEPDGAELEVVDTVIVCLN